MSGYEDLFASAKAALDRPTWRGYGEALPHREFFRQHSLPPVDGFVLEDLDLVPRIFGAKRGTDHIGRIRLLEKKWGRPVLGVAQAKTFGMLDLALHTSDVVGPRYDGFWVIGMQTDNGTTEEEFWANRSSIVHLQQWKASKDAELRPASPEIELSIDLLAEWIDWRIT